MRASPLALNAEGLDPAVVAREKGVLAEKNAGKPPHVLEKIVESGLKTYYKEVCLIDQPFVLDAAKTVAQVRNLAKTRRLSSNRMLVELIENGIEAEKRKQQEFFELAERFRNASDPEEVKRLGDELGRMVFGD